MRPTDIKYYPLPNGEFVVSWWDSLRRCRIQKTFDKESVATEAFNELRSRKPLTNEKRSLKQFSIEELIQLYLGEVPDATLGRSPQLMKDFLEQFALYKYDQITEMDMRCFFQRQKLEYDYTSHSLATRKYQLQGLFKWMVSRGLIEDSPQSKISMGRSKVYRRKHIWVKPHQFKAVIKEAQLRSPGLLYPILLLISETAAKTSDILDLKWKDIDFKSSKILLRENDKITKRESKISNKLVDALKSLEQISEFIFTNLEGRSYRKEILVRELRIFKRQVGITNDWVYRDLRYSFAVNFLKDGGDIKDLQNILGHNHARMTEELYGLYKAQKADFLDVEVVPETEDSSSETCKF